MGEAGLSEAERAAAFAKPAPPVPRRAVLWIVGACLVLGFGGLAFDHFVGVPSAASAQTRGVSGVSGQGKPAALPSATAPTGSVPASLPSLMGLQVLHSGAAPPFSLHVAEGPGAGGPPVPLARFRGKVVVLSFFDARCDDICPVLASELQRASRLLETSGVGGRVEFLTVNTDPLALSAASAARAGAAMHGVTNWLFLTGSLRQLNAVWTAYGISIQAQPSTGVVAHSEALYFIGPTGRLAERATPFANQVGRRFVLVPATADRFASGIALQVKRLLSAATAHPRSTS